MQLSNACAFSSFMWVMQDACRCCRKVSEIAIVEPNVL